MKRNPGGAQFGRQSALETDGKRRLHFRTQVAMPRQRHQKRFNTAEEIARTNVQNIHAR
jgi:hypothetical protein